MTKLLSSLILVAFAFSAQAASHTGGAPMKADSAKTAASGSMSAASAAKKHDAMKDGAKHDKMKKEEAKK